MVLAGLTVNCGQLPVNWKRAIGWATGAGAIRSHHPGGQLGFISMAAAELLESAASALLTTQHASTAFLGRSKQWDWGRMEAVHLLTGGAVKPPPHRGGQSGSEPVRPYAGCHRNTMRKGKCKSVKKRRIHLNTLKQSFCVKNDTLSMRYHHRVKTGSSGFAAKHSIFFCAPEEEHPGCKQLSFQMGEVVGSVIPLSLMLSSQAGVLRDFIVEPTSCIWKGIAQTEIVILGYIYCV